MAVLISIHPEWCEKIVAGRKTLELRKTKPALPQPFKCYIYQTKHREHNGPTYSDGKVIGEFVCDHILGHCEMANADIAEMQSCVRREDIFLYSGGKEVFGWHISNLVIYDEPKKLSEFYHDCGENPKCDGCPCLYTESNESVGHYEQCCSGMEGYKPLIRPPQSWCYVEEATP